MIYDPTKRTVWLHVHVPKAGGSTLRQLFNRNFDKGYYNSVSLLEVKQYSRDEIGEIIRCHPLITCISDHKFSLDLPYHHDSANVFAISFVREPIARFVSRYFFHRHFEEVSCLAQRMSFREFAEAELEQGLAPTQINSQIYFLNGGQSTSNMTVIEQALTTGNAYLFPIEYFDEACVCLEKLFPQTFSDLSYVSVNISKRDQTFSQEDLEFIRPYFDADQAVVKLAHDFLEQTISRAFNERQEFEQKLVEFRQLCRRRYDNFAPPRPI
ncbi:MAG TPA: sulfotransferase family 2 domain-containing protein [Pirellulaceae bacterium]|nr:sulfotransferase family 2 domain-containing protein [Pirellulaceae bacterium]HMO92003.1 sulfotransferase family 2 domain-containing protein [Pirellulaceae bacterium]HMP68802.1 sulfotransferase family 2 domain-containing protein [Pirellulaceae bacterium]